MRIIHTYPADDVNGEGLRVVAFFAGCKWNCPGCFNPQTHSFEAGEEFTLQKEKELFDLVDNDYITGITFTGGDPLFGGEELIAILKRFRARFQRTKDIWIYTGFETQAILDDPILKEVFTLADVLCTGKFVKSKMKPKKKWVGSNNQEVIHTKDYEVTM